MISAYVTCPDITLTVTPDLKLPGRGRLLHVDLGRGRKSLGGSALAQAYQQVHHSHVWYAEPLLSASGLSSQGQTQPYGKTPAGSVKALPGIYRMLTTIGQTGPLNKSPNSDPTKSCA